MDHSDNMQRLLAVMARLRHPERGCPWDREQDFATIAPYTIEEAYEVAEAISQGDMTSLKDELGDLLFQVVFHARMADEKGHFTFDDVAAAIADKMVRRHPHVFGTTEIASAEAQTLAWEEQKAQERRAKATGGPHSALDGVGLALPALTRAQKIQSRAARVGFDWPEIEPVFAKIAEEIEELRAELAAGGAAERLEDELGDLLFATVNLARHLKIDSETALRKAVSKFERRFRRVEAGLAAAGKSTDDATLDEMEAEWRQAKVEEAGSTASSKDR
jgi:nucleoside triphosphate diphosphatase